MLQIPVCTLNGGKLELFKEILLLWCFTCTVPLSSQQLQLDICATQPSFVSHQAISPPGKMMLSQPRGKKRGFSRLSLRFQQSQHLISNFTSCKGQPKIPQTKLLWQRWKIWNFCEKPRWKIIIPLKHKKKQSRNSRIKEVALHRDCSWQPCDQSRQGQVCHAAYIPPGGWKNDLFLIGSLQNICILLLLIF